MDPLLPLRALARLLAVEEAEILAWVEQGEFPAAVALPNGEPRWRRSSVVAWQCLLTAAAAAPEPVVAIEDLPELAQEILQVLEEAKGKWMTSNEIAAKIGDDVDGRSGHFGECCRTLKRAGLIESSRQKGYKLRPEQ